MKSGWPAPRLSRAMVTSDEFLFICLTSLCSSLCLRLRSLSSLVPLCLGLKSLPPLEPRWRFSPCPPSLNLALSFSRAVSGQGLVCYRVWVFLLQLFWKNITSRLYNITNNVGYVLKQFVICNVDLCAYLFLWVASLWPAPVLGQVVGSCSGRCAQYPVFSFPHWHFDLGRVVGQGSGEMVPLGG